MHIDTSPISEQDGRGFPVLRGCCEPGSQAVNRDRARPRQALKEAPGGPGSDGASPVLH